MTNIRLIIAVFVLQICLVAPISAESSMPKITLSQLQEMFSSINEQTPWDMSGPMLWGYFFTSDNRSVLENVAPLLEAKGLRLVSIYLADKDSPLEPDLWWLHVARVETHGPESLNNQNLIFYRFADEHDGLKYDGMDVGPSVVTP